MSKTGLPIYSNNETNNLYKKIYGVNDKITPLVDESLIENKLEEYNSSGIVSSLTTYVGRKLGVISQHDTQLYLQDNIKKHNQYLLSDSENILEKIETNVYPINIEEFAELDNKSLEFKQNICFRKAEYKLLSILLLFLDKFSLSNDQITFEKNIKKINDLKIEQSLKDKQIKELYDKKQSQDKLVIKTKKIYNKDSNPLKIDWEKINKIEVGGLIIMDPKPSSSTKIDSKKRDMIKLYKIIYIGLSPNLERREIIVVRHILFPKYYIVFTGLIHGVTKKPILNKINKDLGGTIWHYGHMSIDMLGFGNQVREVNIQCNDEIHEISVHIWMWEMAQRHTPTAIQKIEEDYVEWWKVNIDDSVTDVNDIAENYCKNEEEIYCNTNQNKKNSFFYNYCIPKESSHCCDNVNPQGCMRLIDSHRTENNLTNKIKKLAKIYYGDAIDNFDSFRHGRPDISIIGCSLGCGVGQLSILVLIDYFSKKNQKMFNIDATFFSGIKSTCLKSFDIMRRYDNIIPINFVNSKLEFITEPTGLYMHILKDSSESMTLYKIKQECERITKKKFHITDIYNFIPAISIDPFARFNFLGHKRDMSTLIAEAIDGSVIDYFDHIPVTYMYFGCKNTIYKDIGVYNGKICPIYKNRKDDGSIDNGDISQKIIKFKNYFSRQQYDIDLFITYYNAELGIKLHDLNLAKDAMESFYEMNKCDNITYEY